MWPINGVVICDTVGAQGPSSITMSTDTTVVVVWADGRNGFANRDVYAQSLRISGAPMWAIQGLPVCDTINRQEGGEIVTDGIGGTIICWLDERSGYKNIFAQRINSNGQKLWMSQGVAICTTNSTSDYQKIVPDGRSGAIICWQDRRSGNWDVYAQHIDSLGNILWDINGMPVCTAVNNQQYQEMIASDSGTAIICWSDWRSGSARGYAQKVGDEIVGITERMQDARYKMQDMGLEIYPNPSSKTLDIRWQMADNSQNISLKIYDATGRVVRQFNHPTNLPFNQVIWDGRDNDGKRLPGGIYFCELKVDEQRLTKKLILLR